MTEFFCNICGEPLLLPEDGSNTLTCENCNSEQPVDISTENEHGDQHQQAFENDDPLQNKPSSRFWEQNESVLSRNHTDDTFHVVRLLAFAFLLPLVVLVIGVVIFSRLEESGASSRSSARSHNDYVTTSTDSIPAPPKRDLTGNRVQNGVF